MEQQLWICQRNKLFCNTWCIHSLDYTVTEGFLMVVDLQGVDRDDKYILTDPSVHCKEPRFGLTNLGAYGMEQFFKSHRCGSVCEAMKLEKNRYMKSTTPRRLSKLLTKILWI